jgi:hypothetical protein
MRFLVDELPERKEDCPFFVSRYYINDATYIRNYCKFTKEACDLFIKTCSGLLEGAEREIYYT